MRTLFRSVGWTMIWSGLFLFAFLGYQLWGTGVRTDLAQAAAEDDLADQFELVRAEDGLEDTTAAVEIVLDDEGKVVEVIGSEGVAGSAFDPNSRQILLDEEAVAENNSFATIRFPTLVTRDELVTGRVEAGAIETEGTSWVVFEGTSRRTLKLGPGHMIDTPLPGQPGNAVISGHRTTYSAPFNRLDELEEGDPIIVETAIGTHVYVVRDPGTVIDNTSVLAMDDEGGWFAVRPTALWVKDAPAEGAWLTLTTCHPEYSARQRLIVVAELVAGPNHAVIYKDVGDA
jgi:LPXTG-site transpeptidase (sortase) family protein